MGGLLQQVGARGGQKVAISMIKDWRAQTNRVD
jgi:hypothetical protein